MATLNELFPEPDTLLSLGAEEIGRFVLEHLYSLKGDSKTTLLNLNKYMIQVRQDFFGRTSPQNEQEILQVFHVEMHAQHGG